jgi:outer membrane protein TolC
MKNSRTRGGLACLLTLPLLLGACANTPPSPAVVTVEQQLNTRYPALNLSANSLGQVDAPLVMDQPLSLQKAIQILLAKSPQVSMQLAAVGIAEAAALQAELIDNPHISIGALKPEGGGRWQLDTSLSQPLLALFTRPLRRQLAREKVLETQLQLQGELQLLIAQTSTHYFAAVAAMQHCYVQNKMLEATQARQQLALSLYRAGNMSENNFLYYDNELRRVQQQTEKRQSIAYEKQLVLLNFIGLPSTQRMDVPTQLPALPAETITHSQLLDQAKDNRLDIKIAQQQLALLEKRRQLVREQNGWRDLSLGINAEREFDGARNYGPEMELALPIFNRGQGKLAAIDAQKAKLDARLRQLELDADSAIAQALNTMDSARIRLKNLEAALAVAERRVELSHREVNFMLTSPLELLSIKRQQIRLAHELTETLKDYWQARAQLELAVGQSIPLSGNSSGLHTDHTEQGEYHHD